MSNAGIQWGVGMTWITKADFHRACKSWQAACSRPDGQQLFEKYVDVTVVRASKGVNQFLMVTEKSAKRIEALIGPHAHTIIKAHVACIKKLP